MTEKKGYINIIRRRFLNLNAFYRPLENYNPNDTQCRGLYRRNPTQSESLDGTYFSRGDRSQEGVIRKRGRKKERKKGGRETHR